MSIYKPTYFYNQRVNNSLGSFNSPSSSSKKNEANRGGLNKINNEIKDYDRTSGKDLINFALDNNESVHECPPPEPTPTPQITANPVFSPTPSVPVFTPTPSQSYNIPSLIFNIP
jgi:hypothetical protein